MAEMTAPAWAIEDRHLEHARELARTYLLHTPLVPAPALGRRVLLKLETEQHTGSFKVRGALARLAAGDEAERARRVVAASAGNHGMGVAWAARRLGRLATVVVPPTTPLVKRDAIAALGASIEISDEPGYDAAERVARALAEARDAVFVSPYDDPWVAAGNGGTVGLEILGGVSDVYRIVAPVGGGGLMAGLAAARSHLGRAVGLVGVQSEVTDAMHRSLEEGRAIEDPEPVDTLCEGLEGGVSPTTFALVRDAVERIDRVSEQAVADAMRWAYRTLGITMEGSAATVVAWARERPDELAAVGGAVVLVVTGRNVDSAKVA